MEQKEDKLMSIKDVQEYLGIGRDKVYGLFRLDDFPAIKINKKAIIYKSDLVDWLKANRTKTIYI